MGDLAAGRLETTLETERWSIGDDTKELADRRLGTTLEIFALKDWRTEMVLET